MKLHLGCGSKFFPGWVHYDALPFDHVDVVGPVDKLNLPDNVADLIYASHLLEHIGRRDCLLVLSEWYRVLKPGGLLRLAVPDFHAACEIYLNSSHDVTIETIKGLVCGGQKDAFDFHFNIFDFKSLTDMLLHVGFTSVSEWDWRSTEHSHVDDYSQAYIPHMEKSTGRLVSLNLEAMK